MPIIRVSYSRVLCHAALAGAACALLVGLAAPQPVAAQQLTPVFVVPTDVVTAGGPVSVWLAVLNASDRAVPYAFPAVLGGRLRAAGVEHAVSATLRDPAGGTDSVIPPGGYVRREYVLTVPEGLQGQVVLDVPSLAANAVALEVRRADAVAKTTDATPPATAGGSAVPPKTPIEEATDSSAEAFFKEHFSGYEPTYFIIGPENPNAKIQISFKYQLFSNSGPLVKNVPALKGVHLAYTQTSLWDLESLSKPFVDTSYKPELFFVLPRVDAGRWGDWIRLDLQAGLQHESNGKSGTDSRSLNIAYFDTKLILGTEGGFQVSVEPRVWAYLGSLDENPDIANYRGYFGLRTTLGWDRGLWFAAKGQVGDDWNRGSLQLDLSYPLMRFLYGNLGLYLYAQYFLGYGESLLHYNERSSAFRLGFALYR
jgi:phospholipase A1